MDGMGSESAILALSQDIDDLPPSEIYGRVQAVRGLMVEVAGPVHDMGLGTRLEIEAPGRGSVVSEVVGFQGGRALCMPYQMLDGVRLGCKAVVRSGAMTIKPSDAWLGRIVNGLGEPIDKKGDLPSGVQKRRVRSTPPPAHCRKAVGPPIDLGVRVLNTFTTCCEGQRMGIFAGSGVGKSMLFSMLARNTDCDVAVIGLIGERGREVREFINEQLAEAGLERSIVVVATSDEAPVMRRQAAYMTFCLAAHFRDEGKRVLLLMDSVTRFAMAQREIGLATGEPPATKGYTPTVFSELPRLLERAGPGTGEGTITGIFTVLVEGDDHNEPISDAVRGILDGHIVMEREIAERGRYPAINVLKSVSRTMPGCVSPELRPVLTRARELMASYADMEELIRIGAYRRGADPTVDEAIRLHPALETFLAQGPDEAANFAEGYHALAEIVGDGTENIPAD